SEPSINTQNVPSKPLKPNYRRRYKGGSKKSNSSATAIADPKLSTASATAPLPQPTPDSVTAVKNDSQHPQTLEKPHSDSPKKWVKRNKNFQKKEADKEKTIPSVPRKKTEAGGKDRTLKTNTATVSVPAQ